MIEKRYFKRIWEEEYYIFDSQTISENEFDEKVEYEDYQAFADSMQGDEVVNKLNQLNDENEQLKHRLAISEKANFVTALENENEQLKTKNNAYIQDIEVFKEENTHLKLENEQLKSENDWLKSIHFANDVLKENKELKQSNERLLKMLDNVANYMQKQNKYMPIDDFVEWWNGIATKGLDDGDVE